MTKGFLETSKSELTKVLTGYGESLVDNVFFPIRDAGEYIVNSKLRMLNLDEIEGLTEEEKEKLKKVTVGSLVDALGLDVADAYEGVESIEDFKGPLYETEVGEKKDVETIGGTVGEIATYLPVFSGATGLARLGGLGKIAAPTAGGAITEQILTDPSENLFNVMEDVFPEATKDTFVEYMAADPEDTETTQRMKMLIQDVGLIPLVERGLTFRKYLKNYSNLTKEQEADVVMKYLADAREAAKLKNISDTRSGQVAERTDLPSAKETLTDVDERTKIFGKDVPGFGKGIERITRQTGSGISPRILRFKNKFFSTNGFYTRKAYNAFRDTQYAQRQTISAAEHIANRLNIQLKKITDITESKEMSERVQEALTTDVSFMYDLPEADQLSSFQQMFKEQFNLTDDIASEVASARLLMDGLSNKLVASRGFSAEAKEAIASNVGGYLRRSYRAFEDPSYKPTSEVRQNAVRYLADDLLAKDPDIDLEEALGKAEVKVREILGKFDNKKDIDFLAQVKRVAKFKKKQDIPEPIRALLGEIKEPSENIILSVAKASRIYEVNNFYRQFNQLGKTGKYLFTNKQYQKGNVPENYEQIKGTNSILDGKWTTPELINALERKEDRFNWVRESELAKNYALVKGFAQQQKTVMNNITHARNFLGAGFFATLNGINPLAMREFLNARKVVWNQISKKGDKAVDQLYEKYLRLGLINTNVKVNEFRSMLDTGYQAEPTKLLNNLGKIKYVKNPVVQKAVSGVKGYGKFQDLAEDVYVATDDFFKVNIFEQELETLKKAFPNTADDILELEASRMVQDTVPNYDKVPKGIKAWRDVPLGNFISFPAEGVRTSINIVKQASKEINSDNPTLIKRGLQRLAGFTVTSSGFTGLSAATASFLGWSDEEREAHTVLAEGPYNKNSPKIWSISSDGQVGYFDTKYIDPIEYIKTPINQALGEIQEGKLKGKELSDYLADAAFEAGKAILEPFVGVEMVVDHITDVKNRYEQGYIEEVEAFFEVMSPFVPGYAVNTKKLIDAVNQRPVPAYDGQPKSALHEFLVNVSGIRVNKHLPEINFANAIKEYRKVANSSNVGSFLYTNDLEKYAEEYEEQQKKLMEAQQDLFVKVKAYTSLYGRQSAMEVMQDNELGRDFSAAMILGNFYARPPQGDKLTQQSYNQLKREDPETAREQVLNFKNKLNDIRFKYHGSSLFKPELKYDIDTDEYREEFKKGGEVFNVPSVPTEPDQRIDKMTGMPYDQQAGTAFVDVEDPLRRMGFGVGSLVKLGRRVAEAISDADDEVIKKAPVKNVDDTITPYEYVPTPATYDEMFGALDKNKKEKINIDMPEGENVELRLDIPAYNNHNVWVPTVHYKLDKKKTTSHRATAAIKNVDFSDIEKPMKQAQATKIRDEVIPKGPFATIKGNLVNRKDSENFELAEKYLNDPEWTQVGFNPKKHSYFFDRRTGDPVIGGEEAIQVGPLVLVKKAVIGDRKDFAFAEGGKVLQALRRTSV